MTKLLRATSEDLGWGLYLLATQRRLKLDMPLAHVDCRQAPTLLCKEGTWRIPDKLRYALFYRHVSLPYEPEAFELHGLRSRPAGDGREDASREAHGELGPGQRSSGFRAIALALVVGIGPTVGVHSRRWPFRAVRSLVLVVAQAYEVT